jgi:hypothetical protein
VIDFSRELSRHYLDGPVIGIGESPNKILTIQEVLDYLEGRKRSYFQLPISDLSGHDTIYTKVSLSGFFSDLVPAGDYCYMVDYNQELEKHHIGVPTHKGSDHRLVEVNQFLEVYPQLQLDLLSSFLYIDPVDKPVKDFIETINHKDSMLGLYNLMLERGVAPEQLLQYPHVNILDFGHTGSSIVTFLHILRTLSPPGVFDDLMKRLRYVVFTYPLFDSDGGYEKRLINEVCHQVTHQQCDMIHFVPFSEDLEEPLDYFFNSENHKCRCIRSYKYKDWSQKTSNIAHLTPLNCNLYRLFIYRQLLH